MAYGDEGRTTLEFFAGFSTLLQAFDTAVSGIRRELGLSNRCHYILGCIALGQRHPTDIAGHLRISSSLMSFELDKLVAANLVHRAPDPNDGRRILLSLTEEGDEIRVICFSALSHILREKLKRLPARQRLAFLRAFAVVSR
jgi:DNA-binding MarR family transcriptional regulator